MKHSMRSAGLVPIFWSMVFNVSLETKWGTRNGDHHRLQIDLGGPWEIMTVLVR